MQVVRKKYRRVFSHNKDQVVNMYLAGLSMKDIADLIGLSKTKVHDIVHEAEVDSPDSQIFLRHKLAVNLRKNGLSMRQYLDLIRARHILVQLGVRPQDALCLLREVLEECFRGDLHPQSLVTLFSEFSKFVFSINTKTPEDLKIVFGSRIQLWECVSKEVDRLLGICGWLRWQIDILQRRTSG